MEKTHIFEVVRDQKPRDLHLEQGSFDLAGNVVG